jgi:hypothetical protein
MYENAVPPYPAGNRPALRQRVPRARPSYGMPGFILSGATKESLPALPEYTYAT